MLSLLIYVNIHLDVSILYHFFALNFLYFKLFIFHLVFQVIIFLLPEGHASSEFLLIRCCFKLQLT